MLLIGSFAFYLHHVSQQRKIEALMVDEDRNYELLPFDMLDAERYCRLTLEQRYGDDLVQQYVDAHSSRMDAEVGLFKVFMVIHVGNQKEYNRDVVHCFVDPERRLMTHFRVINLKRASLMSRATKFFE